MKAYSAGPEVAQLYFEARGETMSTYTPQGNDATLYKQVHLIDDDVDEFIKQHVRPRPKKNVHISLDSVVKRRLRRARRSHSAILETIVSLIPLMDGSRKG